MKGANENADDGPDGALIRARNCVLAVHTYTSTRDVEALVLAASDLAFVFDLLDGWLSTGRPLPKAWERRSETDYGAHKRCVPLLHVKHTRTRKVVEHAAE